MAKSNYGPYGVSINYRVNVQTGGDLEKALSQHFSGLKSGAYKNFNLLAYRNWAGPVTHYHAFIPFEKFGDLDNWPSSSGDHAAAESGAQSAGAGTALGSDSKFLELVDSLSRVPQGAPAAYVMTIEYRLKPGAADEFEKSAGKALNGGGVESVLTYRSFAGTTDSYHVALPFNKFADLDNWKSTGGVLTGDVIKHVQVSFAELVPSLSNPL